ncbi:MAG: hypothetical protein Q3972_02625 [Corynebacterium sp.]|nr:hypothetical protein [Corynebacterium sp.]
MAFSACSSSESTSSAAPEEQASESTWLRPSQATSSAEDEGNLPGVVDCIGNPLTRPSVLHLDCTDQRAVLANIVWDSWDATSAVGNGTDSQGRSREIMLAHPTTLPNGFLVFSSMLIDGTPNTP